jgi:uncharacterized protein (TIGR00106 family)
MRTHPIKDKIVVAEISLVPIVEGKTSMSREISVAFAAIKKTKGLKATLTGMGTQVEAEDLKNILAAVEAAHKAVIRSGASRVISTIRIDERLDKSQTLDARVLTVKKKLDMI